MGWRLQIVGFEPDKKMILSWVPGRGRQRRELGGGVGEGGGREVEGSGGGSGGGQGREGQSVGGGREVEEWVQGSGVQGMQGPGQRGEGAVGRAWEE